MELPEIEQVAHQLVTQMLFHEGLSNEWIYRFKALTEINKAVENYKKMFAHLAIPEDYPKEESDAAKEKITRILKREHMKGNKTSH